MMDKGYSVKIDYGKIIPKIYFRMLFLALCSIWGVSLFENLIKKVSPFNFKGFSKACSKQNWAWRIWNMFNIIVQLPGMSFKEELSMDVLKEASIHGVNLYEEHQRC